MADLSCPSARAEVGAGLIGIVQSDGKIGLLGEVWPVSSQFLNNGGNENGPLEARFRFTGPCQQSQCAQWSSGRCSIADKAADLAARAQFHGVSLPDCAIRGSCRWFRQNGPISCHGCEWIVTEERPIQL